MGSEDIVAEVGTDHCEICGETITMIDIEHGEVAEMFLEADPFHSHKICHYTCGQAKGLELA